MVAEREPVADERGLRLGFGPFGTVNLEKVEEVGFVGLRETVPAQPRDSDGLARGKLDKRDWQVANGDRLQ